MELHRLARFFNAGALGWQSMGQWSKNPWTPYPTCPQEEIVCGLWRLMGAGLGVRLRLVAWVSKAEMKMELGHRAWQAYATDGLLDVG